MILCIAQVEDSDNLEAELAKQTKQPDKTIIYVDPEPAQGIQARRKRIAQNHIRLKDMVEENPEYDLVLQVEGDCVLSPNTIERLYEDYEVLSDEFDDFAYVSGVQIGRHGIRAIGAWHFNEDRTEFKSVDYKNSGMQKVDATGFYCLLADRDAWLDGQCSWNGERYGPDVVWGLSLRDKGYDIFVDMDLHIGHRVGHGVLTPESANVCNVTFNQNNGEWSYKIT